ncbi:hypothetical protein E2C01_081675 [Portunus trituberculatus]|uniref:Uncharacterized protein n=1 Tax=Portunus trituberculatus TaxID=210409 RepID=A0A5B7IX73_PORTR|nr:hypothetical protein [Portunus trituberculatus]
MSAAGATFLRIFESYQVTQSCHAILCALAVMVVGARGDTRMEEVCQCWGVLGGGECRRCQLRLKAD